MTRSRAGRLVLRVHRALLPDEPGVGWVPYLWLVYYGFFALSLLDGRTSPLQRGLGLAGSVLFLGFYFRGYWTRGRAVLPYIAGLTALGLAFAPFNPGAGIFFVYATAFAGRVGPPRTGLKVVAAVVASALLEALLVKVSPSVWVVGSVLGVLIGLVNIYYEEVHRKASALRLSQEEVRRLAVRAERERIARDLHDLLGHTLSVITLKSELAGKLVARDPERAAAEIRDIERISREALAEVRSAVTGYRAAGLAAELASARLALETADVAATIDGGDAPLPPATDAVLALVLREAVTNVVRHARATRCRIALRVDGDEARLEVSDDGRGGVEEASGLAGMRSRLAERGGSLEVVDGDGTTLRARLPLDREAAVPALRVVAS